jgi:hypothetical protein
MLMMNLSVKSMSVVGRLFFVWTLLAIQSSSMQAGGMSPLLSKIAQALECSQKESNPGWKLERAEPITPNENVLIEMFVSGGRRVKVSILEHKSEAAAIETMKRGAADNSAKALLKLGDEAYTWGYSDAIAFRKGNLTVYVSAVSDIDALLPMLDQSERESLRRSEEVAINKSLARTIANVLSALDQACQPMDRV